MEVKPRRQRRCGEDDGEIRLLTVFSLHRRRAEEYSDYNNI